MASVRMTVLGVVLALVLGCTTIHLEEGSVVVYQTEGDTVPEGDAAGLSPLSDGEGHDQPVARGRRIVVISITGGDATPTTDAALDADVSAVPGQ